jgi:hypothetical protein
MKKAILRLCEGEIDQDLYRNWDYVGFGNSRSAWIFVEIFVAEVVACFTHQEDDTRFAQGTYPEYGYLNKANRKARIATSCVNCT